MKTALGALGPDRPRFKEFPAFTPDLGPVKMSAAGIFDGCYYLDASRANLTGIDPEVLMAGPMQEQRNARKHNMFGVHSGLPIAEWRKRGWIRPQDPFGWYQWYCRFHAGRRTDDDERQVRRWTDFSNRWRPKSEEALERMRPGPKTRQALLHWGISPWAPEEGLGIVVAAGRN